MGKQRLFQDIAEKISDFISDGVFPPGSRLPGERDLAERFGVSRVTVREAAIALQAVGKVDIRTGSGIYVSDDQPIAQNALPEVSAFELTEARSLIEAEAAALAAKSISDESLAELDRLIEEMASSDKEVALAADREFHAVIARASANKAMVYTIETLWRMREELPTVKSSYDVVCYDDAQLLAKEHKDILEALKARDPVVARRAMREHFRRLISTMLDASEKEAMREVQQRLRASRVRFLDSSVPG